MIDVAFDARHGAVPDNLAECGGGWSNALGLAQLASAARGHLQAKELPAKGLIFGLSHMNYADSVDSRFCLKFLGRNRQNLSQ
jgi:hypothetical protein